MFFHEVSNMREYPMEHNATCHPAMLVHHTEAHMHKHKQNDYYVSEHIHNCLLIEISEIQVLAELY